jgi:hypothetical protein
MQCLQALLHVRDGKNTLKFERVSPVRADEAGVTMGEWTWETDMIRSRSAIMVC